MILPLLPFYAQELDATPARIGWLFASYSLAQLVFAIPAPIYLAGAGKEAQPRHGRTADTPKRGE